MADRAPNGSLRRLRIATGVVLTTLVTIMLGAEIFAGNLGIRSDYQVEPLILGTVVGALLLVIGIEAGARFLPSAAEAVREKAREKADDLRREERHEVDERRARRDAAD